MQGEWAVLTPKLTAGKEKTKKRLIYSRIVAMFKPQTGM
jgi:hypothetical protein